MRLTGLLGTALAATLALAACAGPSSSPSPTSGSTSQPTAVPTAMATPTMGHGSMSPEPSGSASGNTDTMSPAANLRTDLNYLLGDHQILAFKATGAALGGRQAEFEAYGSLLNTNGTDLGAAIGSIYGQEAQDEWNRIWSAHNGFFVDYTTGVAKQDMAMQDKAVEDLTTVYVPEFAKFLAGATQIPEDALVALISEHVLTTKAIVDAQASEDWSAAAKADRTAAEHMAMIGDPLAQAIVTTMADKFQ